MHVYARDCKNKNEDFGSEMKTIKNGLCERRG